MILDGCVIIDLWRSAVTDQEAQTMLNIEDALSHLRLVDQGSLCIRTTAEPSAFDA